MVNGLEEARGRYEILRVVNRGGMGEIALGRVRGTKGFEKLVVLTRLRADAEREDHMQMFDVEQELMSRIEHPNIVKVFDQPIIDGIAFLAMEYVRGRNLDQVVRQTKDSQQQLPPQFALTVISEVLRGLAFVHRLKDDEGNALGVVHQDITPSNIMVSFFGEVKITDFGISYVTSRDGGLRRGVLKGKPRYVAPEVLAGKRVNNRADIYGVCVVLYELLTLNPLFAKPTVKDTLAAVARGELPDFSETVPDYTEGLGKIFHKALAKDPLDRYRTCEEMGADVVAELAKFGGAFSPARLGYMVRQQFRNDPDVPEIDPAFEEALAAEAQPVLPSSFRPPDLSQTLSELDRLLGPQSTDLFTLPTDLKVELAGLDDMEPFMALTPIPDFVWDAPSDAELLRRAQEEYGHPARPPEPAPLFHAPAGPEVTQFTPDSALPAELVCPPGQTESMSEAVTKIALAEATAIKRTGVNKSGSLSKNTGPMQAAVIRIETEVPTAASLATVASAARSPMSHALSLPEERSYSEYPSNKSMFTRPGRQFWIGLLMGAIMGLSLADLLYACWK